MLLGFLLLLFFASLAQAGKNDNDAVDQTTTIDSSCLSGVWTPNPQIDTTISNTNNCLNDLIRNNHYDKAFELIESNQQTQTSALNTIIETSLKTNQELQKIITKLEHQNEKRVIKMIPSIHWYQTLTSIEFELVYAARHDLPGCTSIANENIQINKTHFSVTARCTEEQRDQPIEFAINFPFWRPVNEEKIKIEQRPMGSVKISIQKLEQPGRWITLTDKELVNQSFLGKIKLDIESHTKLFVTLSSFQDDAIGKFDGYDIYDITEEKNPNDFTFLYPETGPGDFKNIKKKKKVKKTKK